MTTEKKLDILDRIIFEDEGRHLEDWERYFLRTYWEITGRIRKDCQNA